MADVVVITSRDPYCGISNHTDELVYAVSKADLSLRVKASGALDPATYDPVAGGERVVHLNYHAALHSRWTPVHLQGLKQAGKKVVVTYHDTGVPNSDQCKALHAVADAFVIHEPADDLLGAIYWRMGVVEWTGGQWFPVDAQRRPYVGTAGHDFGWKCWDRLAEVSAEIGWGLLLCCPTMTEEREAELRTKNPWVEVRRGQSTDMVICSLRGCDATAWTFVTHNTGQSASILLGIAACKPVIAFSTCRQFRALYLDSLGREVIRWVETFEDVRRLLRNQWFDRLDSGIVQLADKDSWIGLGKKYAALYRSLL